MSGASQAAWSVTGTADGNYISLGGEFPSVDGVAQQGLVRFAVHAKAPDKSGPTAVTVPAISAGATPGTASIAWTAAFDRDNENLSYSIYRDHGKTAIYTTTVASTFYQQPRLTFTDSGLSTGTHSYQIRESDPDGNAVTTTLGQRRDREWRSGAGAGTGC